MLKTSSLSMLKTTFVRYLSNKQARRDSPYQIRVGLCVRQVVNNIATYYFTYIGFSEYLRNQKIPFDPSLMREIMKRFGAKEDTLTYTNARGDVIHFPCWSKLEDRDIDDAYEGELEIETGDKAGGLGTGASVSDADNTEDKKDEDIENPYTEEDKKNAKDLF